MNHYILYVNDEGPHVIAFSDEQARAEWIEAQRENWKLDTACLAIDCAGHLEDFWSVV